MMNTRKNVYTVGQINSYIKHLLGDDFLLKNICVKGEVSNCKYHRTGHIYFSLKDETGALQAVMFSSYTVGLKFRLEDGMQVIASGSISAYERSGTYQLYARDIQDAGRGELLRQYEELKARLGEMGMFADEYKKPIPPYALDIGVVTADTGAVIHDIENISRRRNPYCRITLYPAQVQGKGAAGSICRGLEVLDGLGLDVIIVGRGGGSVEDLWCFNEESVARAIFACETPVISAVGHETDFTIADFVADRRAATPSEAAELAVFDYAQFVNTLETKKNLLFAQMERKCILTREKIKHLSAGFAAFSPAAGLAGTFRRVQADKAILEHLMAAEIKDSKARLAVFSERLEGLSPLKRLSGGYAFVSDAKGRAVKGIGDIDSGENIFIRLRDGRLMARVEEKYDG